MTAPDVTPVIIWDIDDVWHPWYDIAHELCIEAGLTTADAEKPTAWAQHTHYGVTLDEWIDALSRGTQDGRLHHSVPDEDDLEVFRKLWADGADHHFVTARGFMGEHAEQIRALTASWVEEHFSAFYSSLHFSQDKGEQARLLHATHAIDDSYRNWKSLDEAGVEVYLMNQPWNLDAPVPADRRVNSIAAFGAAIENGATQ